MKKIISAIPILTLPTKPAKATMRQPAVENMRKALFLQLTVGVLPMYAVVFVGYWAFGNSASSYLLSSISGPVWLKTAANLAAFFQSVIVLAISTFLAALLPFLGDFMSLTGASCTIPLTFILGNHMYMTAKGNKLIFPQRLWHWLNIGFFSLLSVAAAVASVRLIVEDSKTYHVFGDL